MPETVMLTARYGYVTQNPVINIARSGICSAYLLDQIRDPTTPLLSKVNRGAEF